MKSPKLNLLMLFFLSFVFLPSGLAQTSRYDNVDRSKGLDEALHHDSTGNISVDFFKRSIAQFKLMEDNQQAYMGQNVDWKQIGPSPATVKSYLETNGQMPGPNASSIIDLALDPTGTTDMTAYAITNDGGIWKTTDGGNLWVPKTDKLGTLSFGAIALDPSDPQTIYAGTGNIFNNGYFKAIGIYVSTDGGDSWTLTPGSEELDSIGINKMIVPRSGTILVGTTEGLFVSANSGTSYSKVTIDGQDYGYITDLDIQDGGTKIWAAIEGKGIYVSTNYGSVFGSNLLGTGRGQVPDMDTIGFISLGVSSDGNTLYANGKVIGNSSGKTNVAVWKSVDSGTTWTEITDNAIVYQAGVENFKQVKNCQCGYDQTLGVDPANSNRVYMGFQDLWMSEDGGNTWKDVSYTYPSMKEAMHVDHHALVFSPPSHRTSGQPTRIWVGNDGGVWSSANNGDSWINHNSDTSPTPQMSFATNLFRGIDTGRGSGNNDYTYGGMQDTGTALGRRTIAQADGSPQPWTEWAGGDGSTIATSWQDPNYAYGQWVPGLMYTTNGGANYQWATALCGTQDTAHGSFYQIETNPTNNAVYMTGTCHQKPTIFVGLDNHSNYNPLYKFTNKSGSVRSIGVTPANGNIMYVSLSDGSMHKISQLNGNVTATPLSTPMVNGNQIPSLAVNQQDSNMLVAVYAGYSGMPSGNSSQHVFLSYNGGTNWEDISGFIEGARIPDMPIYSAVFDPNTTPISILVSSDMGVMRSYDFGLTWHVAGSNLPNVHTVDLEIDATVNPSLIKAGTYGRSTWASELPVDELVFGQISPNNTPVTNITWINNTNEELALSKVSSEGEQSLYASIPAYARQVSYNMFYTGVTVVRDQSENIVLVYVANDIFNQTVTISQEALNVAKTNALKGYPGLRSYPNGGVTAPAIFVSNNSGQSLQVCKINQEGKRVLIAVLSDSQQYEIRNAYFGDTYVFYDLYGRIGGVFVASNAPNQMMTIDGNLFYSLY